MGVLTTAGKNAAADAVADVAGYAALHTGDPGATGANNEVAGGTPAYARKAITWGEAASGEVAISAGVEFDVPAGTVSHYSLWSASTGGTCYATGSLSASETFAAQGTYTLTAAEVAITDPA